MGNPRRKTGGSGKLIPDRQRSLHEAGHCVAAICHGDPIRYVSIERKGPSGGRCQPYRESRLRCNWFAEAVCRASGWAAEVVGGVRDRADEGLTTDFDDFMELLNIYDEAHEDIAGLCLCEQEMFVKQMQAAAEVLIREWWPGVAALADVLLERRRLTGKAAKEIVLAAMATNSLPEGRA